MIWFSYRSDWAPTYSPSTTSAGSGSPSKASARALENRSRPGRSVLPSGEDPTAMR